MRLIYAYAKRFRNFKEIGFSLDETYQVKVEKTSLSINEEADSFSSRIFNKGITSVHGIVGRNASGKTNLADMIAIPLEQRSKQMSSLWGRMGEEQAYFLIYVSTGNDSPGKYYLEIFAPEMFSELFADFENVPQKNSFGSYFSINGEGKIVLEAVLADASPEKTFLVLNRESLSHQVFDPKAVHFREFETRNRMSFYDLHKSTVLRNAGSNQISSISSEIKVFRSLKKIIDSENKNNSDHRYRKRLSGNCPLFHDTSYDLAFTWDRNEVNDVFLNGEINGSRIFPGLNEFTTADRNRNQIALHLALYVTCATAYRLIENDPERWIANEVGSNSFQQLAQTVLKGDSLDKLVLATFISSTLGTIYPTWKTKLKKSLFKDAEITDALMDSHYADFYGTLIKFFSSSLLEIQDNALFLPVYSISDSGDETEKKKEWKTLFDQLDKIEELDREIFHRFFHHVWLNTSDGETRLIQGFATLMDQILEFFPERKSPVGTLKVDGHFILVLDEPEIHMHPDLERQFLWLLTMWLNEEFPDADFQLILLTHSPFLLSDIDRQKVLLIRRDERDFCIAEHPSSETFAANIHSLLREPIFLDAPYGQVSTEKLQKILNDLTNSDTNLDEESLKNYELIIKRVGEPLLRSSLQFSLNQYRTNKNRRKNS